MAQRLLLQAMLEECLGSRNVYYQPPESLRMQYPAIRYKRRPIVPDRADNIAYRLKHFYELVLIDPNPDSPVVEKLAMLPYCRHEQHFETEGLNHDMYTIYF